jgi:hypothetical protein
MVDTTAKKTIVKISMGGKYLYYVAFSTKMLYCHDLKLASPVKQIKETKLLDAQLLNKPLNGIKKLKNM